MGGGERARGIPGVLISRGEPHKQAACFRNNPTLQSPGLPRPLPGRTRPDPRTWRRPSLTLSRSLMLHTQNKLSTRLTTHLHTDFFFPCFLSLRSFLCFLGSEVAWWRRDTAVCKGAYTGVLGPRRDIGLRDKVREKPPFFLSLFPLPRDPSSPLCFSQSEKGHSPDPHYRLANNGASSSEALCWQIN